MKKLLILALIPAMIALHACKKDKDSVSTQNIHGHVYNLANDSGLANVTVFLNINNSGSNSSITALTDGSGNFSFPNVQIHSSNDYTYSLQVPSNGAGGYKPAIDGATLVLNKSKLNQLQVLHVIPHFNYWYLYFPNTLFTSSDTFVLTMKQNTIFKNLPGSNWQLSDNCPCPITSPTNYIGGAANYWMGWWQVTLDQTKNGIHTINTDSFYLAWGATVTDTIPW